jgi:hypothetical protein
MASKYPMTLYGQNGSSIYNWLQIYMNFTKIHLQLLSWSKNYINSLHLSRFLLWPKTKLLNRSYLITFMHPTQIHVPPNPVTLLLCQLQINLTVHSILPPIQSSLRSHASLRSETNLTFFNARWSTRWGQVNIHYTPNAFLSRQNPQNLNYWI